MSYIGNEPIVSATRTVTEVTATAGQTVFNANGGYTVGYLDVFLNGSKLTTTDFTATNGSSITLTEAAQVGDIVRLEALGTFQAANAVLLTGNSNLTGNLNVSGNLGVGTTSPTNFGSAFKMLAVQGSDYGVIQAISSSGSTTLEMMGASGIGYVGTRTNHPVAFRTNDTERMRIDSSGNLLVGTTSGAARLFVQSDASLLDPVTVSNTNTTANSQYAIVFVRNGVVRGSIQTTNTATSYITSSDYRLKENIAPMTGALATVQALKPVTYTWKADGSDGQGFIAHELQEVVPDCVTGEKDAVETYIDEDGVEQTRPKYQGIDTSFLVATLTAAIQEQQAQLTDMSLTLANANAIIQSQADTITAMELRLTALEGKL